MAAAIGTDWPAVTVVIVKVCYCAVVVVYKFNVFAAVGEFLVGNIVGTSYPGRNHSLGGGLCQHARFNQTNTQCY